MNYKYLFILISCIPFVFFAYNNKKKPQESNRAVIDDTEEVHKIGYSIFGGWIGPGYNIVITPDSIHYFYNVMTTKKSGKYDVCIPAGLWVALLKELDLTEFEKIESTPSIQAADGSDREFFIETNKRKLSFINGKEDEHYIKLKNFFDAIIKLEYECRVKAQKDKCI
jgi:hypothetical protein